MKLSKHLCLECSICAIFFSSSFTVSMIALFLSKDQGTLRSSQSDQESLDPGYPSAVWLFAGHKKIPETGCSILFRGITLKVTWASRFVARYVGVSPATMVNGQL